MPTLTVPFASLSKDDVIVNEVGRVTVEGTRRADGAIRLVNPYKTSEWWAYPADADEWVIERAAVAPEPPVAAGPRHVTRRRRPSAPLALPMRKVEAGVYETPDGSYRAMHCFYDHYCEQEHPMRTGRGRGEMCPGNQWHALPGWMFRERNVHGIYQDITLSGLDVVATLREAVEIIADHLGGKL